MKIDRNPQTMSSRNITKVASVRNNYAITLFRSISSAMPMDHLCL